MRLIEHLTAAAGPRWTAYVDHDDLRRLAENQLPASAFHFYRVQDYLFLVQFARAQALAGYAEIAARLSSEVRAIPGHRQGPWVEDYAGADDQAVAEEARVELNRLGAAPLAPSRLRRLEHLFATACDLEAAFWQMALDEARKETP